MRTNNSIKNSITSLVANSLSFFVAFIAQAIFLKILDAEYLGLNGLFTNVLSMLSIFELGIGNAIVFNLYKPIAEDNKKQISALMNFYKKVFNVIILLIFITGLCLIPFIKYMVNDVTIDINIYFVYILFLASTLISYFMAYKRNLLIANQQNYIINIIHMLYLIMLNLVQLLLLYLTRNYYLYLIIKIICQLLENFIFSIYVMKKFTYLSNYKNEKLSKKVEKDIFSKIKGLICHKIGSIIVLGTDNIIISSFLGIITVGLYTNYNTVINGVSLIFSQMISTTTSSVGNLMLSKNVEKKYDIFKKMRFLNSWISIFTSICILILIQPFISLWVGEQYKLPFFVVIIIVFNFFQKMQRQTFSTFKDSAGIWKEDRYVPLIESFCNIIFSIILLKIFGLAGVLMGTIISGLALWGYSYPKFVYKGLFNRTYKEYAKETIGYILLFIIVAIITYYISNIFVMDSIFVKLIINFIICLIIPNLILFIVFRKTDNFKYFIELLKKILFKLKNNLNV